MNPGPLLTLLRRLAVLCLAVVALAGCDQAAVFDSLVTKEESRLAKDFVAQIAARDYTAVEAALDPQFRTPDLHARLEAMAAVVPAAAPMSVSVIGSHTMVSTTGTRYRITLQYEYPTSWLLAAVLLERSGDKVLLQGINFVPRSQSMEAENRFTLDGKGPVHYIVLTLAVAIPLLVVYALVLCIRTPMPSRKWLWVVFVALGLVQCQFEWTSGAWRIQPLSVIVLGAGFAKPGPFAPWVFTLSMPLGALLFMHRRRAQQRLAAAQAALEHQPPGPA